MLFVVTWFSVFLGLSRSHCRNGISPTHSCDQMLMLVKLLIGMLLALLGFIKRACCLIDSRVDYFVSVGD